MSGPRPPGRSGGPIRAVALGYQGFGNAGDEAILDGIEAVLAGSRIRVTSVICGPGEVAAFPSASRLRTRRLRPSMSAIRALRRARLLLLSGGGLIHDHWWSVMPTYLAWVLLARALGLRVAWVGVGVGPLHTGLGRWLAARAARASHLVTVRDETSARILESIAPNVKPIVIPDPAVFAREPEGAPDRHGVGLIVRGPTPRHMASAPALASELAQAAVELARRGRTPVLLTIAGSADTAFASAVSAAVREAGGYDVAFEALPPDPGAVMKRIAALQSAISVRLHGLILGAIVGTPVATVAYDPKVATWAERLGAGATCVAPSAITARALLDALAAAEDPETRRRVAANVARLRAEASRVRELLEEAA